MNTGGRAKFDLFSFHLFSMQLDRINADNAEFTLALVDRGRQRYVQVFNAPACDIVDSRRCFAAVSHVKNCRFGGE